jgi:hypothetical protein
LKHLPHEHEFAGVVAITDTIANHAFAERRGKFRREIAHLVGVREEYEIRRCGLDHLLERDGVTVGRVGG